VKKIIGCLYYNPRNIKSLVNAPKVGKRGSHSDNFEQEKFRAREGLSIWRTG